MVVKSKRGRRRYVAITLDPSFEKETLIGKVNAMTGGKCPKIIQCSSGWCIFRCAPGETEDCMNYIKTASPDAISLRTSGTLITLRKRYPVLMSTRPQRAGIK